MQMDIVFSLMTYHRFVTGATRRMPLVDEELFTISDHQGSPQVFCGVRVIRSLVLCVMFCRSLLVLLTFFLAIALSVLLRFTDSDYPFGIFKFFLC
jgi:hypothetical protein